jgi:glycosyltransferase involved in cell wall biosynthesis
MIDATSLLLRSAGVKTYTFELIKALREEHSSGDVCLFPFLDLPPDYDHERSPFSYLPTMLRIAALHFGNIPNNPAWNLLGRDVDVFHCSNQCKNPPQNTMLTATVHDMTCWLTPEFHSAANVKADAYYAERVLKRAHGLIAVSENSRRDAIKVLGIPDDRIVAIHPGVASHFFDVPRKDIDRVRARLQLARPYVLSVGTIEPRKNTDRLLAAWSAMRKDLREEFDLVFAGPLGWASPATKLALHHDYPPENRDGGRGSVRYLGYVAECDLAGLTAGAAALAYPSLYEGFGLPVAQAMAAAVPVVTSDMSSLPEVAGDAAVYADPRSVDSIRVALEKLLESEDLRRELGRRGRNRAENYRWEVTARKTWTFWKELCAAKGLRSLTASQT